MCDSALLLPQWVRVLPQVYWGRPRSHLPASRSGTWTGARTGPPDNKPGSGAAVAGVDLHGAGDGLEWTVPEVVESFLVQVVLLLTQALLEELPLVSELDHSLGVGVEGGDGGGHAAGEGSPRHAEWNKREEINKYEIYLWNNVIRIFKAWKKKATGLM